MTREHKLALIIGFSVFLVVGVLVGDYFSKARMAKVDPTLAQGGLPARLEPALAEPVDPIDRPLPGTGRTTGPDVVVEKAGLRPPGAGGLGIDEITMGVKRGLAEEDVVPAPGGGSGTPAAADEVYTVQAGDSLYKIASKQMGDGRLAGKLAEYNKAVLKGGDRLSVGMQLKIPAAEGAAGKGKPAGPGGVGPGGVGPAPKPAGSREVAGSGTGGTKPGLKTSPLNEGEGRIVKTAATTRTYTVKAKDTLGHIASATLGSAGRWREIADLNGISAEDLRVGMVLKLPAK